MVVVGAVPDAVPLMGAVAVTMPMDMIAAISTLGPRPVDGVSPCVDRVAPRGEQEGRVP